MDPPIRAGFFAEKATRASLLIYPKIAIPGENSFRTSIDTFLGFTGDAEKNLLLFGPVG
jgi:hypothetical protein